MQEGIQQEVAMRLETITAADARALLMANCSAEKALEDMLGRLDPAKLLHFANLLTSASPQRGVWHPTMSAVWIDPDGTVGDGIHRLYACAITGRDMEVIVCRGQKWTPVGQLMVDDFVRNWLTEEEWLVGSLRGEVGLSA